MSTNQENKDLNKSLFGAPISAPLECQCSSREILTAQTEKSSETNSLSSTEPNSSMRTDNSRNYTKDSLLKPNRAANNKSLVPSNVGDVGVQSFAEIATDAPLPEEDFDYDYNLNLYGEDSTISRIFFETSHLDLTDEEAHEIVLELIDKIHAENPMFESKYMLSLDGFGHIVMAVPPQDKSAFCSYLPLNSSKWGLILMHDPPADAADREVRFFFMQVTSGLYPNLVTPLMREKVRRLGDLLQARVFVTEEKISNTGATLIKPAIGNVFIASIAVLINKNLIDFDLKAHGLVLQPGQKSSKYCRKDHHSRLFCSRAPYCNVCNTNDHNPYTCRARRRWLASQSDPIC